MARDWKYKKIMNSARWKYLREKKLHANPECEECAKKGKIRLAVEVHHIVPIESAPDFEGMKRLAFDYANLESVCRECHHEIHREMGSHLHNKDNMKRYQNDIIDRYLKEKF
jgi:5-methylcytosine-specific restriction protein A